jgi:hypothetical protein
VETHNALVGWLAKEQYTKIWNDELLRLEPKKTKSELMHPKINLVTKVFYSINIWLWIGRAKCKWSSKIRLASF